MLYVKSMSLDMLIIREKMNCQFEGNETGSYKVSVPQREDHARLKPTYSVTEIS